MLQTKVYPSHNRCKQPVLMIGTKAIPPGFDASDKSVTFYVLMFWSKAVLLCFDDLGKAVTHDETTQL